MADIFANVFKTILALLLVPLLMATVISFNTELSTLRGSGPLYFLKGVLTFLIIQLFILDLMPVYKIGQNIVGTLFRFSVVLSRMMTVLVPFYSLFALLLFYFFYTFYYIKGLENYALFLFGFTMTLHLVLTAKDLQAEDESMIKPTYFLFIILIGVINFIILGSLFDLVDAQFSVMIFLKMIFHKAKALYLFLFQKLF